MRPPEAAHPGSPATRTLQAQSEKLGCPAHCASSLGPRLPGVPATLGRCTPAPPAATAPTVDAAAPSRRCPTRSRPTPSRRGRRPGPTPSPGRVGTTPPGPARRPSAAPRCRATRSASLASLRGVLLPYVNRIRREAGLPDATRIEPGMRGRDDDCPVARTIGAGAVVTPTHAEVGGRIYRHPWRVRRWLARFDAGRARHPTTNRPTRRGVEYLDFPVESGTIPTCPSPTSPSRSRRRTSEAPSAGATGAPASPPA